MVTWQGVKVTNQERLWTWVQSHVFCRVLGILPSRNQACSKLSKTNDLSKLIKKVKSLLPGFQYFTMNATWLKLNFWAFYNAIFGRIQNLLRHMWRSWWDLEVHEVAWWKAVKEKVVKSRRIFGGKCKFWLQINVVEKSQLDTKMKRRHCLIWPEFTNSARGFFSEETFSTIICLDIFKRYPKIQILSLSSLIFFLLLILLIFRQLSCHQHSKDWTSPWTFICE